MSTNEEVLQVYKSRYDFNSWPKDRNVNANLFISQFRLAGNEFARWEALTQPRRVELPGMFPLVTSTWRYQKNKKTRVSTLSVEITECDRRADAHAELLQLLRQFHSGDAEPYLGDEIGDVAFTNAGRTVLLFTRANLAVKMANGSDAAVPVDEWAFNFDKYLIKRPVKTSPALKPEVEPTHAPVAVIEGDALIPLEVKQKQWAGPHVWYKFFSRSGRVRRYRNRTCYRAAQGARHHHLTVFAVTPSDGVGKQRLDFDVDPPDGSAPPAPADNP